MIEPTPTAQQRDASIEAAAPACAGAPLDAHPDHHLWRNGRLWWVAYTVHHPDYTAERIRRSLHTADRLEARRRRDALFAAHKQAARNGGGTHLSLRFAPCAGAAGNGARRAES